MTCHAERAVGPRVWRPFSCPDCPVSAGYFLQLDQAKPGPPISEHVHDTLLTEIRRAHASTVNAAVRREGEWWSLSYTHQLGFGV